MQLELTVSDPLGIARAVRYSQRKFRVTASRTLLTGDFSSATTTNNILVWYFDLYIADIAFVGAPFNVECDSPDSVCTEGEIVRAPKERGYCSKGS